MAREELFAVFVDFSKAFNLLNRNILMAKVHDLSGQRHSLTRLIGNMLANNSVRINVGTTISTEIPQTNGVLQGDLPSPLLFNLATIDVVSAIQKGNRDVNAYIYADDIVILSNLHQEIQSALDDLSQWSRANEFHINKEKTVTMVFQKGGEIPTKDQSVFCEGERLTLVNSFRYLGVTLSDVSKTLWARGVHGKVAPVPAIFML
jgi:hypothetical protein